MKTAHFRTRFILSKILLLMLLICRKSESLSLNHHSPSSKRATDQLAIHKPTVPFLAAWCFASLFVTLCSPAAVAAAPLDSFSMTDLKSSLTAPTADMPQLPLPTGRATNNNKQESQMPPPWKIQALISIQNPNVQRPLASDVLVLQVFDQPTSGSNDSKALGGAKIPVAKLRFPASVSLGLENAKQPQEWKDASSKQDLWLQASICNEEASKFPCQPEEQAYRASGISKLLNQLPNENGDANGFAIRVPASLILEKIP